MICRADTMRAGLPYCAPPSPQPSPTRGEGADSSLPLWERGRERGVGSYCSQGCTNPGILRLETEKPVSPALGLEPLPVAPSSRISPPLPVAAPANGAMAVGWLCVSTFIRVWVSSALNA